MQCSIGTVRRSSFRVEFEMRVDGRLAAEGYGVLVGFDYVNQQAAQLPDALRERLEREAGGEATTSGGTAVSATAGRRADDDPAAPEEARADRQPGAPPSARSGPTTRRRCPSRSAAPAARSARTRRAREGHRPGQVARVAGADEDAVEREDQRADRQHEREQRPQLAWRGRARRRRR